MIKTAEYNKIKLYTSHKKVRPESVKGKFRDLKRVIMVTALLVYAGLPWLRWNGRQAILFDVVKRKFHIFSLTLWPQDIYYLTVLLFLSAITLFLMSAVFGRIFCGFFCFQTLFTDLFMHVEQFIERSDKENNTGNGQTTLFKKIMEKSGIHLIWLVISFTAGLCFTLYFADAHTLTLSYLNLNAPTKAYTTAAVIGFSIYSFAGYFREHVCFFICPYARFQGSMIDDDTLTVSYDKQRGCINDDCINCNKCFRVCPTGTDIRKGNQYGCISCGLCIDACNGIMNKFGKDGLIRFSSLNMEAGKSKKILRPRILIYLGIIILAGIFVPAEISNRHETEIAVTHYRQPLFIKLSDGSIKNRYRLKIMNKSAIDKKYNITIEGLPDVKVSLAGNPVAVKAGEMTQVTFSLRMSREDLETGKKEFYFVIKDKSKDRDMVRYKTKFFS